MENAMRKLAWEGVQKNIVMDGDTMIDKLILHIGKISFKLIFYSFYRP